MYRRGNDMGLVWDYRKVGATEKGLCSFKTRHTNHGALNGDPMVAHVSSGAMSSRDY